MSAVEILLVEDNEGDVQLTREALDRAKVRNNLHVAYDGVEAMDFLRRKNGHASAPRPDLVLLDLNLPNMDGREVLQEMKSDPTLKTIPVVVITSSEAEQDVVKTYSLNANCYVTKPLDLGQFMRVVQSVSEFWLQIVKLPPKGA